MKRDERVRGTISEAASRMMQRIGALFASRICFASGDGA